MDNGLLSAFKSVVSGKAVIDLKFDNWSVVTTGPFSFEIVNVDRTQSYFFKDSSAGKLSKFKAALEKYKMHDFKQEQKLAIPRIRANVKVGESLVPINDLYRPALMKDFLHLSAVKKMILTMISEGKSDQVTDIASMEDVKDLLTKAEFENYIQSTLKDFLANSAQVAKCPKCNLAVEVAYHTWASKLSNLTKEMGIDKRPMTDDAQKHFLANRIRCRNEQCETVFCKQCKTTPYHTGFNCAEYKAFLNAPHCRYCTTTVM